MRPLTLAPILPQPRDAACTGVTAPVPRVLSAPAHGQPRRAKRRLPVSS
ncbi:hypothetical protein C8J30_10497 [Rhodobacter viridis]|uniref:Uncharacterized protein n=1 Tax=Rhodobacter viridis TaxID=1054202 RepID=A0A318U2F8_9RHOB|nr:hypothetical protein C8J30_10497 [Rhodobacter viridis]